MRSLLKVARGQWIYQDPGVSIYSTAYNATHDHHAQRWIMTGQASVM